MNTWALYDSLLMEIPNNETVMEVVLGPLWVMITTNTGNIGVAMTIGESGKARMLSRQLPGKTLREAAECAKDWDFTAASIGVAAINAYYNREEKVAALTPHINKQMQREQDENAFIAYGQEVAGKKVGVIGHFPNLEELFKPICELSIFERDMRPGDYPDTASEYLLCEQDYVFITGCALSNKTMPRLLELSKQAKTVLVGPSTPLTPLILQYGADDLAGFVVIDYKLCKKAVLDEATLFECGKMVRMIGERR